MKNNKLVIWAMLAAMTGFSACSNNTEDVPIKGDEIKLLCGIIPTRVTSLTCQSTKIVEGQQVGVTIVGAYNEHDNVSWRVMSDGTLIPSEMVYWAESQATITAYQPFNTEWTGTEHVFTVNTDQSEEKNYLSSDLLWTQTVASNKDVPVNLLFSHQLAKINVTLKGNGSADLSNSTIYICGTRISAGFNPSTGKLSEAILQVADIKAGVTTDEAYTSSAIVIPQVVNKGSNLIKIVLAGKEYNYQLPDKVELKSGHFYNFELHIGSNGTYQATGSDFDSEWV